MTSTPSEPPAVQGNLLRNFACGAILLLAFSSAEAGPAGVAQRIKEALPAAEEVKERVRGASEWMAVTAADGVRVESRTLALRTIRQSATEINRRRSVGVGCGVDLLWATHHLRWSNALSSAADAMASAGSGDGGATSLPTARRYPGEYRAIEVQHAGSAADLITWMYAQEDICRQLMSRGNFDFALAMAPAADPWGRHRWVLLLGQHQGDKG